MPIRTRSEHPPVHAWSSRTHGADALEGDRHHSRRGAIDLEDAVPPAAKRVRETVHRTARRSPNSTGRAAVRINSAGAGPDRRTAQSGHRRTVGPASRRRTAQASSDRGAKPHIGDVIRQRRAPTAGKKMASNLTAALEHRLQPQPEARATPPRALPPETPRSPRRRRRHREPGDASTPVSALGVIRCHGPHCANWSTAYTCLRTWRSSEVTVSSTATRSLSSFVTTEPETVIRADRCAGTGTTAENRTE